MSQGHTPPPQIISNNLQQRSQPKHKKKSRRRANSALKLLNENVTNTPSISSNKKKSKSRKKLTQSDRPTHKKRRSRSNVDLLKPQYSLGSQRSHPSHGSHDNNNNDNTNLDNIVSGAAYRKSNIVLTKDTGAKMCVIKEVRNQNGLQYGISVPPGNGVDRYIKPSKIVKKVAPENIISQLTQTQKAYDDAHGELLKFQQQNKMLRKQIETEQLKFKKLKQRFMDQNSINTNKDKKIIEFEKENIKLKKDIEQKIADFNKIKKEMGDDNIFRKQINDLNKQIRNLNNELKQSKMIMNKQKTELSQQKARHNRTKIEDASDSKQIIKLKKEKLKMDRIISDLRKELHFEKNKTVRMVSERDHATRINKMESQTNLQQVQIQNRKLETKLKKLRNKEQELQEKERQQRDISKKDKLHMHKLTLQQQEDIEMQRKVQNRKTKQEMAELEKRRQALLKQQKLLRMIDRPKGNKKDKENKVKRHERIRGEKTKIIVHKKYLCK
eukprot:14586_1